MQTTQNQWLLATASAVAGAGAFAGSAEAQPMPPSAFNWTGFYVGLHVADVRHQASTTDLNGFGAGGFGPNSPPYVTPFFDSSKKEIGFGGHIGYNWQFNRIVAGLEMDATKVGASTTFTPTNTLLGNCGFCAVSATNELDWMATFRGRAGYLVLDNLLVFGTAGLGLGKVDNRWGYGQIGAPGLQGFNDSLFRVSEVRSGLVYGGGVEYAVTQNVLVRLEFMQLDLGTSSSAPVTGTPNLGNAGTFVTSYTNKVTTGRAGLTWKW